MKALSIQQPWIHQIETGKKIYEVRAKRTHYRGPVLLCAGKEWSKWDAARDVEAGEEFGVSVCLVDIVGCVPGAPEHNAAALINTVGLWCWKLENVVSVSRIPIRGKLGLFELPRGVADELLRHAWGLPDAESTRVSEALVRWGNT